jgi:hypothetical protein
MKKGMPGDWYQDNYIGGYFNQNGNLVICEEYVTDADSDKHAVSVQNGNGYYNSQGRFCSVS